MNNKVFKYVKDANKGPDFTGASADYYLQKYINRPEDAGNLKGFQKALSDMGVLNPAADAINAAIYTVHGELGKAGVSALSIIPVIGDIAKVAQKTTKNSEKMITLYRGVDKWHEGKMIKNKKFIGGTTKDIGSIIGIKPPGTLWTSGIPQAALNYTKNKNPLILKFKVPESYILKNADYQKTPTNIFKIAAFEKGLPTKYISKVYKNFDEFQWEASGGLEAKDGFKKFSQMIK